MRNKNGNFPGENEGDPEKEERVSFRGEEKDGEEKENEGERKKVEYKPD